ATCLAYPCGAAGALHKKPWAVIDRPYSLGFATVGALYERPRYISCAKPAAGETSPKARVLGISGTVLSLGMASIVAWDLAWYLCLAAAAWAALEIFLLPTLNSGTGKADQTACGKYRKG